MKRSVFHVVLAASIVFLAAFALLEGAARVYWDDPPSAIGPVDEDIFSPPDSQGKRKPAPNIKKYYAFARVTTGKYGLRGETPVEERPETLRILALGDELVFGEGLKEEDTLTARMEASLRRTNRDRTVQAFNGGVPGGDLNDSLDRLEELAERTRPAAVLISFQANDAGAGFDDPAGKTPRWRLDAERKADYSRPAQQWAHRLAPPSGGAASALKYFLAQNSRAYLFAAMEVRARGLSDPPPDRFEPLLDSPSCAAGRVLYQPLERSLQRFRALADRWNFKPVLFLYSDRLLGPRFPRELALHSSRNGVLFVNLSYLWPDDAGEFDSRWSLGWLPRPNARAVGRASQALLAFLHEKKALEGFMIASPEAFRSSTQRDLLSKYDESAKREKERFVESLQAYGGRLNFGDLSPGLEDRLIHGWWPRNSFYWSDESKGRWMGKDAWVFIGARNAGSIRVAGSGVRARTGAAPLRLSLSLNCVPLEGDFSASGAAFVVNRSIPDSYGALPWLEIGLHADRVATPDEAGVNPDDEREISFYIKNLSIK